MNFCMSLKIEVTDDFKKDFKKLFKKYKSLIQDVNHLKGNLLANPTQGISLGKDCFKIRMAISSKNRGKSGGSRVITCLKVTKETIYLIAIYDKSEMENIDDSELNDRLSNIAEN